MNVLAAILPSVTSRFRDLMGARDIEPETEPVVPDLPKLWVVIASHRPAVETIHGPFSGFADAEVWARVHLKTSAALGWEIEPLYAPEEGGKPPRWENAR